MLAIVVLGGYPARSGLSSGLAHVVVAIGEIQRRRAIKRKQWEAGANPNAEGGAPSPIPTPLPRSIPNYGAGACAGVEETAISPKATAPTTAAAILPRLFVWVPTNIVISVQVGIHSTV
jgi:hypothetical protein